MLGICEKLGFKTTQNVKGSLIRVVMDLRAE